MDIWLVNVTDFNGQRFLSSELFWLSDFRWTMVH
jgi:hypothetical protein